MNIVKYFRRKFPFFTSVFLFSSTTRSGGFSKFDAGKSISFHIKVFGRNIKETTQARYSVKVTAHSSFTCLRITRERNKSSANIKMENM